jgi:CO/xanthine dehydrogenase FAD-binding subunit
MYTNQINTRILYPSFEYFEPSTPEEAVAILAKYGDGAMLLAGGTDLFIKMKQGIIEPKCIVRVLQPSFVEETPDGFHIGAATKLRTIEKSHVMTAKFPALYEAIRLIGSVQIRCMATLGGNLCNASPAADTAPPLLVLRAKVKILGKHGTRIVPLNEFFVGPGKTVLSQAELLTEVHIPHPHERTGMAFIRLSRASMDIAKISIAVLLELDGNNRISAARIALGSVAPTPIMANESAELLKGSRATKDVLTKAAQRVADEIRPITDIRSTAEYRKEVAHVIARDALELAYSRAGGN